MLRDQLIGLLQPVVADLGYELWELEYAARAGGGLLRLYIDVLGDNPDGISVEDCEKVSRAVSQKMDESDPIAQAYTLEVSSPGLDRVLRTRQHFARFTGEPVQVEMTAKLNGRKRFAGRLTSVTEGAITLDTDGGSVSLPFDAIHKARLAPQF